ncbi:hypothetical protein [Caballeronia ptereochthonis]|uniref:Uncharacterized protein n=1 Tax=Caballeronia ptereochthonis TaxID=1777144 RepID=A0A158DZV4_9BURK|nr:hypothetical protein [Caballeronia ptereochthonis]SAK99746.1 hypothetical protein AWB83_06137 [Caballeronia ptereochthonis]
MTASNTRLPEPLQGDGSLIRPRFSAGLLLQDDDLTSTVDYTRDLLSLLLRSMFGCGVLCGLCVKASIVCGKLRVEVARGVALTCGGHLIEVARDGVIDVDPTCGTTIPPKLWVKVCRREKSCAPRETMCSPDDDLSCAYTRTREGYSIELTTDVQGACACAPDREAPTGRDDDERARRLEAARILRLATGDDSCHADHYLGACGCGCDCDCVIIARVDYDGRTDPRVDHTVRRFVRVALLRDPCADRKQDAGKGDVANR